MFHPTQFFCVLQKRGLVFNQNLCMVWSYDAEQMDYRLAMHLTRTIALKCQRSMQRHSTSQSLKAENY